MSLPSGTVAETLNLLTLGDRGVGKTVFLVGSYLELFSARQTGQFEGIQIVCQDKQSQQNIEAILNYISKSSQYPPPTIKITDFRFALKQQGKVERTLCQLDWQDIPGEICRAGTLDFERMVLGSHGCCIFVDANALVYDGAYLLSMNDIFDQAIAIASLTSLNNLRYAFAIVLTKCDLLPHGASTEQTLMRRLRPLLERLKMNRAAFEIFQSRMPVIPGESGGRLEAKGGGQAILWLAGQLLQKEASLIAGLFSDRPPSRGQATRGGAMQTIINRADRASSAKRLPVWVTTVGRPLALVSLVGLVAFVGYRVLIPSAGPGDSELRARIVNYEQILERDPDNLSALSILAGLYQQTDQAGQALPLLEKLAQKEPQRSQWQLALAQVYLQQDRLADAQSALDRVLDREEDNLAALLGKAEILQKQGDTKAARELFDRAEQVAPQERKQQIREQAEKLS